MSKVLHVNGTQLNYLEPLLKWRVLDVENLRKECFRMPEYFNFCKIIRNFEKKNLLENYRHPFNRKKYVYLSSLGESEFGNTEHPTSISTETLIHDIKVSEIAKSFLDMGWVNEVELEHQLSEKRNFKTENKVLPDALLYGSKNSKSFKMALEVELTQKNNQRILEKGRQYLMSPYYDYVLYFFSKKHLMAKFMKMFIDEFGTQISNKFLFFLDENAAGKSSDIQSCEGYFKEKKLKLKELFAS